jgi:hypothetical protein
MAELEDNLPNDRDSCPHAHTQPVFTDDGQVTGEWLCTKCGKRWHAPNVPE